MTEEIKIEKGVPIPESRGALRGERKYPLATMAVGDSFFSSRSASTMSHTVCVYIKRDGLTAKFAVRTVEGGCRVWRIE